MERGQAKNTLTQLWSRVVGLFLTPAESLRLSLPQEQLREGMGMQEPHKGSKLCPQEEGIMSQSRTPGHIQHSQAWSSHVPPGADSCPTATPGSSYPKGAFPTLNITTISSGITHTLY